MNRTELVAAMAAETQLSKKDAEAALKDYDTHNGFVHIQDTIGLKHILISDIGKNITDIYAKLGTEGI